MSSLLKINRVEYANLIQREIFVNNVNSTSFEFETVGDAPRLYNGKVVVFWFENEKYVAEYTIINGKKTLTPTNPALFLSLSANSYLTIYETFKIVQDNELVTFQDIMEMPDAKENEITYEDGSTTIVKSGRKGLLSEIDKNKLSGLRHFIQRSDKLTIDEFYPEICRFKVSEGRENKVLLQLLIDDELFIGEFQFIYTSSASMNLVVSFLHNSLSANNKLTFKCMKHTYIDGTIHVAIHVAPTNNISKDYFVRIAIADVLYLQYNLNSAEIGIDEFLFEGVNSFATDANIFSIDKNTTRRFAGIFEVDETTGLIMSNDGKLTIKIESSTTATKRLGHNPIKTNIIGEIYTDITWN